MIQANSSCIPPRDDESLISPRALTLRWDTSRSTVSRIARRAGFTRVLLGVGKNGLLRYRLAEILAYERERAIKPTA